MNASASVRGTNRPVGPIASGRRSLRQRWCVGKVSQPRAGQNHQAQPDAAAAAATGGAIRIISHAGLYALHAVSHEKAPNPKCQPAPAMPPFDDAIGEHIVFRAAPTSRRPNCSRSGNSMRPDAHLLHRRAARNARSMVAHRQHGSRTPTLARRHQGEQFRVVRGSLAQIPQLRSMSIFFLTTGTRRRIRNYWTG